MSINFSEHVLGVGPQGQLPPHVFDQLTIPDANERAAMQAILDDYQAGQDATDTAVASVIATGGQTKEALRGQFATRRLGLAATRAPMSTTTRGTTPAAIEVFGGYVWGEGGGNIHRSLDGVTGWTVYCPAPAGDTVLRLLPCDDGEVIAVRGGAVAKSTGWATGTPTWTTKVTANGTARFQAFQADGDGTKFIVAQYGPGAAGGVEWQDSRYAHISTDGGNTWTQVWDSVTRHGATDANASHIHGVCYDPWGDRFYLAEGHGPAAGVYVTTNDGATWTRPAGLVNSPPPTVLVATDDGIVGGSDHGLPGIWGIVRQADPTREVITRTWAWTTHRDGVIGFGVRGFRDPVTGVVYIGYRTEFTDIPPIIAGGTASAAGLVWTWPTTPVNAADAVTQVVVHDGRLLGAATISGASLIVRGELAAPVGGVVADTGNTLGGTASGTSVAVGAGAAIGTGGLRSVVVGTGVVTGVADQDVVAVGHGSSGSGSGATAIGSAAVAGGLAVALGRSANAAGQSVAIGNAATTNGVTQAVAIGNAASVRAESVAIGTNASVASGQTRSVAIGTAAAANATNAVAVGRSAVASGFGSVAIGESVTVAHTSSVGLGAGASTTDVAQVQIGSKHIEIVERATWPNPPAADRVRLFAIDNGAGKTRLVALFATGASQQLAIEP